MTIIKTIPETLSKKTLYELTKSPKVGRMRDAVGSVLEIAAAIIYEDLDKDYEPHRVLSIKTKDGELFATNSRTCITEFEDLLDIFGTDLSAVEIISSRARSGREFITCAYAGE